MILERGNMWDIIDKTSLFLVTTNAYLKRDGALVMGRGLAEQVRDKYPGIDKRLGEAVKLMGPLYGFTAISSAGLEPKNPYLSFGAFQVKHHFKDKADVGLIALSTFRLREAAKYWKRIDLNFPGIGNGKLTREEVLPIIKYLPDNVHVWEYEN